MNELPLVEYEMKYKVNLELVDESKLRRTIENKATLALSNPQTEDII